MEKYKRRLISVLPNTDETLFAVFECHEAGKQYPTLQYKVRVKFWAFYEERWNEDSEWEMRSHPLINYDDSIDEIWQASECTGFLGFIGGGANEVFLSESEYLPFTKRKIATAATRCE